MVGEVCEVGFERGGGGVFEEDVVEKGGRGDGREHGGCGRSDYVAWRWGGIKDGVAGGSAGREEDPLRKSYAAAPGCCQAFGLALSLIDGE